MAKLSSLMQNMSLSILDTLTAGQLPQWRATSPAACEGEIWQVLPSFLLTDFTSTPLPVDHTPKLTKSLMCKIKLSCAILVFPLCKNVNSSIVLFTYLLYHLLFYLVFLFYLCFFLLSYPLCCYNTANFTAVGLTKDCLILTLFKIGIIHILFPYRIAICSA